MNRYRLLYCFTYISPYLSNWLNLLCHQHMRSVTQRCHALLHLTCTVDRHTESEFNLFYVPCAILCALLTMPPQDPFPDEQADWIKSILPQFLKNLKHPEGPDSMDLTRWIDEHWEDLQTKFSAELNSSQDGTCI